MDLVFREINRLSEDYYRCPDFQLKQQILNDIALLKEALLLLEEETALKTDKGQSDSYH